MQRAGLDPGLDGGADGIRTHDLLDAIEARSQLRHGPTEPTTLFMLALAAACVHILPCGLAPGKNYEFPAPIDIVLY